MPQTTTITQEMRACIQDCLECYAMCTQTVKHCLELGGPHAALDNIGPLVDCARVCNLSADTMLRASPRYGRFCAFCAEVCDECADDCEQMAGGDQMMQQCAQVCRRCADSCRKMAVAV